MGAHAFERKAAPGAVGAAVFRRALVVVTFRRAGFLQPGRGAAARLQPVRMHRRAPDRPCDTPA